MKLPISIQVFSQMRDKKSNYVYIDKTEDIMKLIDNTRSAFISRPRRFGKSLMIDTIKELFTCNKDLFEDLYAYDNWDWDDPYPVVKLDFTSMSGLGDVDELSWLICENLKNFATHYEIDLSNYSRNNPSYMLENLLKDIHEKTKKEVVFLVDEYDYPLIHNIENIEATKKIQQLLGDFYSVLKKSSAHLHYVLISGVSEFMKLSLFSQANQLDDLTLEPFCATVCGYTHQELLDNFGKFLEDVNLELLKKWYNGYNYLGESVYNPYDILLYLNKKTYQNYWWETGSMKLLIHVLKSKEDLVLPDFEDTTYPREILNAFDVTNIELIAMLWQSGILTFDKQVGNDEEGSLAYKMKYPNFEIQLSANRLFFDILTNKKHTSQEAEIIKNALQSYKAQTIKDALNALFASFPYHSYTNNNIKTAEGYYSNILYTCFRMIPGYKVYTELATHDGRIDSVLVGIKDIFVVEYKVDKSAKEGLEQIYKKKYFQKYMSYDKPIYLLSINFDTKSSLISDVLIEKLNLKMQR